MVDSIRPLSDLDGVPAGDAPGAAAPVQKEKKLYLKLNSTDAKQLRRIDLLLEMFPGDEIMVQYFADLKKQRTVKCWIHPALVKDLQETLGEENVVVK